MHDEFYEMAGLGCFNQVDADYLDGRHGGDHGWFPGQRLVHSGEVKALPSPLSTMISCFCSNSSMALATWWSTAMPSANNFNTLWATTSALRHSTIVRVPS